MPPAPAHPPRRQCRSRRHRAQCARRASSRSGARPPRSRSRPAPTASPRICARIAATSSTTISCGSRSASQSRSISKWRRRAEMVDIALQAAAARRLHRSGAARRAHHRRRARCRRPARGAARRRSANSRQPASGCRCSSPPSRRRSRPRAAIGAPVIEIHTGAWCDALAAGDAAAGGRRIRTHRARRRAGARTPALKFMPATASISSPRKKSPSLREIAELNIGHFLIGEAIFAGLGAAVRLMRSAMDRGRARHGGAAHDPRHRLRHLPTSAASPR